MIFDLLPFFIIQSNELTNQCWNARVAILFNLRLTEISFTTFDGQLWFMNRDLIWSLEHCAQLMNWFYLIYRLLWNAKMLFLANNKKITDTLCARFHHPLTQSFVIHRILIKCFNWNQQKRMKNKNISIVKSQTNKRTNERQNVMLTMQSQWKRNPSKSNWKYPLPSSIYLI